MKNQLLLAFILLGILFINLSSAKKHFKPYCGMKTMEIRECKNDRQCNYSDEFCKNGICTVKKSLYENFDCNNPYINDLCATVRCAQGYTCKEGACVSNPTITNIETF